MALSGRGILQLPGLPIWLRLTEIHGNTRDVRASVYLSVQKLVLSEQDCADTGSSIRTAGVSFRQTFSNATIHPLDHFAVHEVRGSV